jgi:hypothetical protein
MPSKTYGDPGFQAPDPSRQQKTATPASSAQVGDYLDHMVKADQEFHARKRAAGAPPVRGQSNAKVMPTGLRGKQIDRAVDEQDH